MFSNASPAKKVRFWEGVIGDKKVLERHEATLKQLYDGDYKSIRLEVLHGKVRPHLFSIRSNDSDRLLLTTVKVDGKRYAFVIEEIDNHRYDKSLYLKKSTAEMQKKCDEVAEQIKQTWDEQGKINTQQKCKVEEYDYTPVEFHTGKWIELNDEQGSVLSARLPLVVSGPPGSGKTCVAWSLLLQNAAKTDKSEETKTLLYVAESKELVENMQKMWDEQVASGDVADYHQIKFMTYEEMLNEVDPDYASAEKVGRSHFEEWFAINRADLIRDYTLLNKHSLALNELVKETEKLYQEFRIISAHATGEDPGEKYYNLGKKQSLYTDKEEKKFIFHLYQKYQKNFSQKIINPAFHEIEKLNEKYDVIIVDESQDLSYLQLEQLLKLSIDKQIVYCMDSHQSLFDSKSKRPYLLGLIGKKEGELAHIKLRYAYRCPRDVFEMANKVLDIKIGLTGLADKDENESVAIWEEKEETQEDTVVWLNKLEEADRQALNKRFSASKDYVVVTSHEYMAEALEHFPDAVIYTPEDIKGLEFNNVILYRPLDDVSCYEANELVENDTTEKTSKGKKNRAKAGAGHDELAPYFNQLFTSMTRAIERVIIIQPPHHKIMSITAKLQESTYAPELKMAEGIMLTSREEWLIQLEMQITRGNIRQAVLILDKKLGYTSEEKNNLLKDKLIHAWKANRPEIARKIFTEGLGKKLPRDVEEFNSLVFVAATPVVEKEKEKGNEKEKEKENEKEKEKESNTKITQAAPSNLEQKTKVATPSANPNNNRSKRGSNKKSAKPVKNTVSSDIHSQPIIDVKPTTIKDDKWIDSLLAEKNKQTIINGFSIILKAKPEVAAKIFFGKSSGEDEILFIKILNSPLHRQILVEMLTDKKNSELKKSFQALFFGARYLTVYGIYTTSLLLLFNANVLHDLFDKKQHIMTVDLTTQAVLTSLNNFVKWERAAEILLTLTKFHSLTKKMTRSSLCPKQSAAGEYCVPELLAAACIGRNIGEFFEALIGSNKKLAREITAKDLCTIMSGDSLFKNTSLLFWLTGSKHGREILLLLLKENPVLVKKITAADFFRACSDGVTQDYYNVSPFYNLANAMGETASELLSIFFSNKKIVAEMTARDLCISRPSAGRFTNTSALLFLSSYIPRHELLAKLLEENPKIAKEITAKDLCIILTEDVAYAKKYQSPLYCLSASESGRKILLTLLKANPSLAEELLEEVALTQGVDILESGEMSSSRYFLTQAEDAAGKEILDRLKQAEEKRRLAKTSQKENEEETEKEKEMESTISDVSGVTTDYRYIGERRELYQSDITLFAGNADNKKAVKALSQEKEEAPRLSTNPHILLAQPANEIPVEQINNKTGLKRSI